MGTAFRFIGVGLGKVFKKNLGMGEWAPSSLLPIQPYPLPLVAGVLARAVVWHGCKGALRVIVVDLSPIKFGPVLICPQFPWAGQLAFNWFCCFSFGLSYFPLCLLLCIPLIGLQPMAWGFPLFMRGLGWFNKQSLGCLGLCFPLSDPLTSRQPRAMGFLFSFARIQ